MAQLTIRKLDDNLVRRLKIRAAENGRSAEAEVRAILAATLTTSAKDFSERAAQWRAELAGRDMGDSTKVIREQREARTEHLASLVFKPRS